MKVIHFKRAETYEPDEGWKRVSLCNERNISVEYFTKPPGHSSPMHQHPHEQVMVVLKGRMKVVTPEAEEELQEGDAVYIPPEEPHRVENISEGTSIGLDIFCPGRPFDFWKERAKG